MIEATKAGALQCANCDAPLYGRFCGRCGEEAFDPHVLTVRHFITHTLLHETLQVYRQLSDLWTSRMVQKLVELPSCDPVLCKNPNRLKSFRKCAW
jgi:hypothetical protein